jgi:hypothetical protein
MYGSDVTTIQSDREIWLYDVAATLRLSGKGAHARNDGGFSMISLWQTLAALTCRLGQRVQYLAQSVSWSSFHCLDEDALMWASTFHSPGRR